MTGAGGGGLGLEIFPISLVILLRNGRAFCLVFDAGRTPSENLTGENQCASRIPLGGMPNLSQHKIDTNSYPGN